MSHDHLDLSSSPNTAPRPLPTSWNPDPDSSVSQENKVANRKKFLGIRFNCCGLYVRIYVNKSGTAYEGRCPKCAKPVRLKIGEGGTNNRFFEVF